MHYCRQLRHGDPLIILKNRDSLPKEGKGGYLYVTKEGKRKAHHRHVMEEHLGRLLTDKETVHHKNGDRKDNNLTNLELWSTYQPAGQYVKDKIKYAHEILTLYANWEEINECS